MKQQSDNGFSLQCATKKHGREGHKSPWNVLYGLFQLMKHRSLQFTKMAVFWVVASCSLVEVYHRPDDGGSKDLWNIGKLLPDYTAL
jgi:hypothetical protein